jgi:hypothetical protein
MACLPLGLLQLDFEFPSSKVAYEMTVDFGWAAERRGPLAKILSQVRERDRRILRDRQVSCLYLSYPECFATINLDSPLLYDCATELRYDLHVQRDEICHCIIYSRCFHKPFG